MSRGSISVSAKTHVLVKEYCDRAGISMSQLVESMLEDIIGARPVDSSGKVAAREAPVSRAERQLAERKHQLQDDPRGGVRELLQAVPTERIVIDGLWANPPASLLDKIYASAKASIVENGMSVTSGHQGYLRRVSAEFHRRLRASGIYVEDSSSATRKGGSP